MTGDAILITGASSGLGAALARSYAAPAMRLVLVGRDAARLEAVAAGCRAAGAEVSTGRFDVGEGEPLRQWLLEQDAIRPFTHVIACAGVSAGTLGADAEGAGLAAMQVQSNLLGTIHTIEPLLPALLARRAGRVAVIASIAGLRGLPFSPGYSASKAGVRAYGEALRALLAPSGIAVTVVVPGFFATPMTERWHGPTPFMVPVERMAAIVRRGIDARRARVTSPWLLALGVRLTDLMPAALGDAILRGFRFQIAPGR